MNKTLKKLSFFYTSIFNMPRIPNNLHERASGMLDGGMSTEHVARHVGCSSRAIQNVCITFRTTGSTNDLPHSGRPCGQDCYIMNMHLRNRFHPVTATATPNHNNQISVQTVHNCLQENSLHAWHLYVRCVLTYSQNRLNWAHVYTPVG